MYLNRLNRVFCCDEIAKYSEFKLMIKKFLMTGTIV